MRILFLLPLCLCLIRVQAASAQATTSLEGAWERIFERVILPDTTIEARYAPGNGRTKILTATHFAFGQQISDGQEVYAGGGRYSLEGDRYTELIEYHVSQTLVGKSIPFESRIEGTHWHISGVIGQFTLEETWQRIE